MAIVAMSIMHFLHAWLFARFRRGLTGRTSGATRETNDDDGRSAAGRGGGHPGGGRTRRRAARALPPRRRAGDAWTARAPLPSAGGRGAHARSERAARPRHPHGARAVRGGVRSRRGAGGLLGPRGRDLAEGAVAAPPARARLGPEPGRHRVRAGQQHARAHVRVAGAGRGAVRRPRAAVLRRGRRADLAVRRGAGLPGLKRVTLRAPAAIARERGRRGLSGQVLEQEADRVLAHDGPDRVLRDPLVEERLREHREVRRVERHGGRAVPVRAERDVRYAGHRDGVADRPGDRAGRALAHRAVPVADPDERAIPGEPPELVVREVPRAGAGRAHPAVRHDHRPARHRERLVERARGGMREVHHHPALLHPPHGGAAERREPALAGAMRRSRGGIVREVGEPRGAEPGREQRVHGIELPVERVQPLRRQDGDDRAPPLPLPRAGGEGGGELGARRRDDEPPARRGGRAPQLLALVERPLEPASPGPGRPARRDGERGDEIARATVRPVVVAARHLRDRREELHRDVALREPHHVAVTAGRAAERIAIPEQEVVVEVGDPERRVEAAGAVGDGGQRRLCDDAVLAGGDDGGHDEEERARGGEEEDGGEDGGATEHGTAWYAGGPDQCAWPSLHRTASWQPAQVLVIAPRACVTPDQRSAAAACSSWTARSRSTPASCSTVAAISGPPCSPACSTTRLGPSVSSHAATRARSLAALATRA